MSLSGLYKGTTFLSQSPMGPMSWRRDIPQGPVAAAIEFYLLGYLLLLQVLQLVLVLRGLLGWVAA
jgi:hypothetical protein